MKSRHKGANPRTRQCRGKITHRSMRKAELHIKHLVETKGADARELRAYACPRCPGFHVGHKSRQQLEVEIGRSDEE